MFKKKELEKVVDMMGTRSVMDLGITIGTSFNGKGINQATIGFGKLEKRTNYLAPRLSRIDRAFSKFAVTGKKMGMVVGRSISKFDNISTRGIAVATASVGGLTVGMGVLNRETAKMGNLANSVGLSYGMVNGLGSSVRGIGLDYEHVTDMMEEMNNKIGESKVKYEDWLKTDRTKEFKLVGGVDDAFKGLDFSLSDKSFKGLNYEETFKKFIGSKGDKQFELVIDTALKMKDVQKAQSMVDIIFGGEANKIMGYLRQQKTTMKQLNVESEYMNFLNERGLKGAKDYTIAIGKSSTILGSMSKQFSGMGGEFATPYINSMNNYLVANKALVQANIKGFFDGIGEAVDDVGDSLDTVGSYLEPITSLFDDGSKSMDKMGSSGETLGKNLVYVGTGLVALKAFKPIASLGFKGIRGTTKAIGFLGTRSKKANGSLLEVADTLSDIRRNSRKPISYKLGMRTPPKKTMIKQVGSLIGGLSRFAVANPIVLAMSVPSYGAYKLYKETLKKDVMGKSEKRLAVFKRERENNIPFALGTIAPKQAKFEKRQILKRRENLDVIGNPVTLKDALTKKSKTLSMEEIEENLRGHKNNSFLSKVSPVASTKKASDIVVNVNSNITVNSTEINVHELEKKVTEAITTATRKARTQNNNVSHLDEEI